MISTTDELSRFYAALVGGRLLRQVQLAEMETTVPAPELGQLLPGARYGLGLMWIPLSCGGGYYGHGGDTIGYVTWDGTIVDGQRTAVVSVTGSAAVSTRTEMIALVDHHLCDRA